MIDFLKEIIELFFPNYCFKNVYLFMQNFFEYLNCFLFFNSWKQRFGFLFIKNVISIFFKCIKYFRWQLLLPYLKTFYAKTNFKTKNVLSVKMFPEFFLNYNDMKKVILFLAWLKKLSDCIFRLLIQKSK